MKSANLRLFILYIVIIIIILYGIAAIIIPLVPSNLRIIIGFVLAGELIIFSALMYHIFTGYIMPLKSSVIVAEEITKVNYDKRIPVNYHGDIAEFNRSLNMMAKRLQEMTEYEKHQDTQISN